MSLRDSKLQAIGYYALELQRRERAEKNRFKRLGWFVWRWAVMVYHEFVRDDVGIRAESLAYLMLFSLIPLVAGGFFIFTVLAQFGLVQDAIQNAVDGFLATIPGEHREFINTYLLQAKDSYLSTIQEKSGTIGIFALVFLAWVGLKTFNNIERTLNFIWSSESERPFFEKVRNFLVVVVAAPVAITGGLSVPLILKKIPTTRYLLEQVPLLGALLNHVVPLGLIFCVFLGMYRFVPVRRVFWRSALIGAVFATVLIEVSNFLIRLYFQFGMNSAYGKAASVPIIGFWIYLVWLIVITGSEISYLIQNEKQVLQEPSREPTFREAEALLLVLSVLLEAHQTGTNPVSFSMLSEASGLKGDSLAFLLDYLQERGFVVEVNPSVEKEDIEFVLSRDVSDVPISNLLADFVGEPTGERTSVRRLWERALVSWLSQFEQVTIANLQKSKK